MNFAIIGSVIIIVLTLGNQGLSFSHFKKISYKKFKSISYPTTISNKVEPISSSFRIFHQINDKLSLGAPYSRPEDNQGSYVAAKSNILVEYKITTISNINQAIDDLINKIDDEKGVLLTSSYEFPGRYSRWTVGFKAPAIQIDGNEFDFTIIALNERGKILSNIIREQLLKESDLFTVEDIQVDKDNNDSTYFCGKVKRISDNQYFAEEDRSKQPSLFSLVRTVRSIFEGSEAGQLGLYGAFGYDLTFQFEPVNPKKARDSNDQRDLVMFLPDEIIVVDNQRNDSWIVSYEFTTTSKVTNEKITTIGLPRISSQSNYNTASSTPEALAAQASIEKRDTMKGKYAEAVVRAQQEFKVGNLFEVVLSQIFREKMTVNPSNVFKRLCRRNPAPYGFFMNLGRNEYLVGASPEMFVRVESTRKGWRIETCPISGTIERGSDALEDAQQIKKLLSSSKEESELTMCTDVDRNDKSRICIPGSVKVIGRRQIELYSRLIHTVDHVEGILRDGFDALDAFLCHTWAVTVTGAPKTWAIRFIEEMEPSVRHWYGGAVGMVGFDGSLNTGLTLRTVRIKNGIAEVRAGATLLHDSDPSAEEAETELKASAMIDAIIRADSEETTTTTTREEEGDQRNQSTELLDKSNSITVATKVLLVDHEDSFVHTLANYLRQTGAEVITCRSGNVLKRFITNQIDSGIYTPDLVVLSPGPGSPSDFFLSDTISSMIDRKIPIFGVCLGLQGLVEYFGGSLGVLDYPMHGKPSPIIRLYSDHGNLVNKQEDFNLVDEISFDVLKDLPSEFQVARYHSLYGQKFNFPKDLIPTALTLDGVVMALQHKTLPIAAVQFHPESILTLPKHGMKIISNVMKELRSDKYNNSNNN